MSDKDARRDPRECPVFDEAFVAAAPVKEGSASDRLYRWSSPPPPPRRAVPAPARPRRHLVARIPVRVGALRPWLAFAVITVLLASTNLLPEPGPLRVEPLGAGAVGGGPLLMVGAPDDSRPTPRPADSRHPLGTPSPVPADAGPHAFLATQPGAEDPVGYDPCRRLTYVVNDRTAPPEGAALLTQALAQISAVTGLAFELDGATDEPPQHGRPPFQPERYDNRWAPILIAWSEPAEMPVLAGAVAGIGGSTAIEAQPGGPLVYVTGGVVLDGPQLAEMLAFDGGRDHVLAVILHELGHLLGLDHVEDASQLMHATGEVIALQGGDLAGLARLGAGPCVPRL